MDISEHVPYGYAYGLENLAAQEALRGAAVVALYEALCAFGDFWHRHRVEEELALHAMIEDAISHVVDGEPPHPEAEEPLRDLYDSAFEDTDFLVLFDLEDSDDLADLDPGKQMGLTDLRFKKWFQPFGSGADRGVPHPFLLE